MVPCIQQDNITRLSSQMDYIKETVDELKADVKAMPDAIIEKLTEYGDKSYVSRVEHAGFAMQVKLLLLDEPGANLDGRSRRRLIEILDGRTEAMLLATPDLPMIARLCSRVILLDQGHIVADCSTAALLADTALLRAHGLAD